jgi:hypothetical protein
MTEDEVLARYQLSPDPSDLLLLRAQLEECTLREQRGDQSATDLLKVLAVTLFAARHVEDSLRIWRAKRSSFDAGCAIDVQLLCGAGLEQTKQYLLATNSQEAADAFAYLSRCELAGDFEGGDARGGRLSRILPEYRTYYQLG